MRIDEWRRKGRLSAANALSFKITAQTLRCGSAARPYPTATANRAITDRVWFGTTAYNLLESQYEGFYSLTYRAYELKNVTGAAWSVKVGKALPTAGAATNKTRLAVMLLREVDYMAWAVDCVNRTCAPPFKKAIPGTTCQGLTCSGKATGLGGKTGMYRLLVAYPEVCSAADPSCYSKVRPEDVQMPFAKELVSVNVTAASWSLPLLESEARAASVPLPGAGEDGMASSTTQALFSVGAMPMSY